MGHREVRPVPLDWEHPVNGVTRDGRPRHVALHSRESLRFEVQDREEHPEDYDYPLNLAAFMPEIPEGTPLGYQLYEITSEGTPVSPVFATLEELAAYCGNPDNDVTVFADHRWTAEQWLASFQRDSTDVDSLMTLGPAGFVPLGNARNA